MRSLGKVIRKTALGKRVLEDPLLRALITSCGSMGWNLGYAVFNGILALFYRSAWFGLMFAWYTILGVMRLLAVFSKRAGTSKLQKSSSLMGAIGLGMIILAITVSGIVYATVEEKHNPSYNSVVMITIAVYTFYIVIMSVLNIIKAKRIRNIKIIMLRDISLAGAIASVLSLERAMLGTFGNAGDKFSITMEISSGAVAFILIVIIGISMMIQSHRYTKEDSDGNISRESLRH